MAVTTVAAVATATDTRRRGGDGDGAGGDTAEVSSPSSGGACAPGRLRVPDLDFDRLMGKLRTEVTAQLTHHPGEPLRRLTLISAELKESCAPDHGIAPGGASSRTSAAYRRTRRTQEYDEITRLRNLAICVIKSPISEQKHDRR